MDNKCTILCSDSNCIHLGNQGYYSVCNHPNAKNQYPYCGIDRIYLESCKLAEYKENKDGTENADQGYKS